MTHEFLLAGSPETGAICARSWGWVRVVNTGDFRKGDGVRVRMLSPDFDRAVDQLCCTGGLPLVHMTPDAGRHPHFKNVADIVSDLRGLLVGPWKVKERVAERLEGGK